MARIPNTIALTGKLAPKDSDDTYAIYDSQYMEGGYHEVGTLAERDAIPLERRRAMMMCGVADIDGEGTPSTYQLQGGIANENWVEFKGGSGGDLIKVATLAERDAIPEEDRELGMEVLVYADPSLTTPTRYILVGDLTNDGWVEQGKVTIDPNTMLWRGEWSDVSIYRKGEVVTAQARHYIGSNGSYSQQAVLVCKVDTSMGSGEFPSLNHFDLIGMFDIGNKPITTSVTHGLIWTAPEEEETYAFEVGNLSLVPGDALYLCVQNIESTKPGAEAEAAAWQKIIDFKAMSDLAERVAAIETNMPFLRNDFISLETLAERDALVDNENIELVRNGVLVFVHSDPDLDKPTTYMWDAGSTSWIEQLHIDPDTLIWKGVWVNTETYGIGDVVTKDGLTYLVVEEDVEDKDPSLEENADVYHLLGGKPEVYKRDEGTYVAFGQIPAGTNLNGTSLSDYLDKQHFPYMAPAFTSFSVVGQPSVVEVGIEIPANLQFEYAVSHGANVKAGGYTIKNITTDETIATEVAASPAITTSAAFTNTSAGSYTFGIFGTNSNEAEFSKNISISFQYGMFYGSSSEATLDEAAITALTKKLGTTAVGNIKYTTGGYKYLCYPTVWGQVTSFKDAETGFGVAMLDPTIETLNINGVSTEYYVFRTVNSSAASLDLIIAN